MLSSTDKNVVVLREHEKKETTKKDKLNDTHYKEKKQVEQVKGMKK